MTKQHYKYKSLSPYFNMACRLASMLIVKSKYSYIPSVIKISLVQLTYRHRSSVWLSRFSSLSIPLLSSHKHFSPVYNSKFSMRENPARWQQKVTAVFKIISWGFSCVEKTCTLLLQNVKMKLVFIQTCQVTHIQILVNFYAYF